VNVFQIAQHADDLERATAFYTDLLGAPPTASFDPPGLVFFQIGDLRLMLEKNAPSALLYLQVDDVHEFVEEWRAKGNLVDTDPHVIFQHSDDTLGPEDTDEWMAFIRDSENNLIGLVSHHR
jgi:methylmalonyl-CoA/ethylmalonyl-CoA epimerase